MEAIKQEDEAKEKAVQKKEPESIGSLFQIEPLQIEIGYNLIALTDEQSGGDLLSRLSAVRRQCASELGIYVRPIRIRDNLQLSANSYIFKIRGEEAASGELMPGYYLAMDPSGKEIEIDGIPTKEPTFGLDAWWVQGSEKENAEMLGMTVVDSSTVLVTHLTEFIKINSYQLLGRQEVKELMEVIKEKEPAVIEELSPELISIGEIQKVLQSLLRERLPIRDLVTIFESIADGVRLNRDIDFITEHVRQAMARTICHKYINNEGKLEVLTLHPKLEETIADSIQQTQLGNYPVLEPTQAKQILEAISDSVKNITMRGVLPVILCSPKIRLPLKRFTMRHLPELAIISLSEIAHDVEVEVVGTVVLN